MAAITPTATLIRPGYTATTLKVTAGAAMAMGNAGVLDWATGKLVKSANDSGKCLGLVVAGDPGRKKTDGSVASNEQITIVVLGEVHGFAGLTPGKLVYLGATAGTLADTGTVPIGYALTADTVYVMPSLANSAS